VTGSSDHPNRRRSTRLPGYDYTRPGAYFVTICAFHKRQILSEISEERLFLSPIGLIVEDELKRFQILRRGIEIDRFVIMPNHVHLIIQITDESDKPVPVGAHRDAPLHRPPRSLGSIIGQFKGSVTTGVRRFHRDLHFIVWQRNYYEHVIRDEAKLNRIRCYITENSIRWRLDPYYIPDS